jgi:hypothetical protein
MNNRLGLGEIVAAGLAVQLSALDGTAARGAVASFGPRDQPQNPENDVGGDPQPDDEPDADGCADVARCLAGLEIEAGARRVRGSRSGRGADDDPNAEARFLPTPDVAGAIQESVACTSGNALEIRR